jgi:hypothetical protein
MNTLLKNISKWLSLIICLTLLTGAANAAWTVEKLPAEDLPGERQVIAFGGRTIAEFIYGEGQVKPYLALFNGDGQRLTNPGINADGETVGRFPHHRGIYIGWNRIESELGRDDLWHMRGTRMLVDSIERGSTDADGAEIIVNIHWISQKTEDGQQGLLIKERRTIRVSRDSERIVVNHHSELQAVRQLSLGGDLQHAGLHFRSAAEVDAVRAQTRYIWSPAGLPPGNGRIVSDELEWVNFRFPLHGNWYSVTQLNHPANETEELSWRDYGRFGFFRKAELAAGEKLTFKSRFLLQELVNEGEDSALRTQAEADYSRYADGR